MIELTSNGVSTVASVFGVPGQTPGAWLPRWGWSCSCPKPIAWPNSCSVSARKVASSTSPPSRVGAQTCVWSCSSRCLPTDRCRRRHLTSEWR